MKATRRLVIALAATAALLIAAWVGATILRRAGLNTRRDAAITQLGTQTAHDAPCAQGIRRDVLLVNFPAQLVAGASGELLNRDSIDVVPAGQTIGAVYSSTFAMTATVLPELLPSNPTFIPLGTPQTVDALQPLMRKAGQVVVHTAEGAGADIRFAGCLSAENQSPPAVYRAIVGDRLLLTGWSLAASPSRDQLTLALNWHVQAPDIDDVGVLVQLVDAWGSVVVETRGYPLAGTSPSRLWRLGDQWRDVHVIRVRDNALLSGDYRVMVGLFTTVDGQRLRAFDLAGKRIPGDLVMIRTAKE